MKILARIPVIESDQAGPVAAEVAAAVPARPAPDSSLTRRPRASGARFPLASVLALTLVTAAAWALASWNDSLRAERCRLERLARKQPAATTTETVTR